MFVFILTTCNNEFAPFSFEADGWELQKGPLNVKYFYGYLHFYTSILLLRLFLLLVIGPFVFTTISNVHFQTLNLSNVLTHLMSHIESGDIVMEHMQAICYVVIVIRS